MRDEDILVPDRVDVSFQIHQPIVVALAVRVDVQNSFQRVSCLLIVFAGQVEVEQARERTPQPVLLVHFVVKVAEDFQDFQVRLVRLVHLLHDFQEFVPLALLEKAVFEFVHRSQHLLDSPALDQAFHEFQDQIHAFGIGMIELPAERLRLGVIANSRDKPLQASSSTSRSSGFFASTGSISFAASAKFPRFK